MLVFGTAFWSRKMRMKLKSWSLAKAIVIVKKTKKKEKKRIQPYLLYASVCVGQQTLSGRSLYEVNSSQFSSPKALILPKSILRRRRMTKSKAGHGKMWRMRRGRMLRKRRKMAEQWWGFPIFGEGSLECWGGWWNGDSRWTPGATFSSWRPSS